jgi:hypothetical protein
MITSSATQSSIESVITSILDNLCTGDACCDGGHGGG